MRYSICFKDRLGVTESSEFTAFGDDAEAMNYAYVRRAGSAIVEVWKGDDLLTRVFRERSA